MNKEFIPFEQAKIFKHDLSYSGESLGWYTINKELYFGKDVRPYQDFNFMYPAPTYSQAFRWFREKYKATIEINRDYSIFLNVAINKNKSIEYFNTKETYPTYEEAELACLKKLIEIVKNK